MVHDHEGFINKFEGDAALAIWGAPVPTQDLWTCSLRAARTLHRLPAGWLLLDMPGIRGVGISAAKSAVDDAFSEISAIAANCRFADCTHSSEPGCAVRRAPGTRGR